MEAAIQEAGASVYADRGGDWEIKTPAGIRKPDVFAAPADVVDACEDKDEYALPGEELLLVAEVISPGSGSERTDRVRKLKEYASVGIPQYWIAEYSPTPMVQVFVLDEETGAYRLDRTAKAGETLEVVVEADKPFTVRFDPSILRRVP
ncbi:hypothetical protein GCM10022214_70060 [Actinomadura miaoliensis]|uniref:Putative restriction endonuclease domain-containing protein n=1 Tax=Actinomadura miaoliensis TaxID=430685 RepID=A0ABP7WTH0_9ACTN